MQFVHQLPSIERSVQLLSKWPLQNRLVMLILLCIVAIVALVVVRLFMLDRMTTEMAGKAILVTGSSSGFGRIFVRKCLENDLTVFAGCRTLQGVESLKEECSGCGGTLVTFEMDVTSDESVQSARSYVEKQLKQFNKTQCRCFFDDMLSVEDYKDAMEVNAYGVIRVIKAFKQTIKRSKGRIITCTSSYVRFPQPGVGPYAFSKWAVSGYLEVLRHELRPYDVQVITIEPGLYRTGLFDIPKMMKTSNEIWAKTDPVLKKEYGEYWFSAAKRVYIKLCNGAPEDLGPVADTYLHAVRAKYPYRNYSVGLDTVFVYRPFSWLPTRLQEVALQILQWVLGAATPDIVDT